MILKYKAMFLLIPILILGGCTKGQPIDSEQEDFLNLGWNQGLV